MTTSVADVECNDLPAFDVESNPYPLLARFFSDEAKHLIDFRFECVDDQLLRFRFDLEVQIIGQLLIEIHHESKQPAQTHALNTTDSPQRYPLQKQSLYPLSLGVRNENLCRVLDELSAAFIAIVILLGVVRMAVLFGIRAVTVGTPFFHGWLMGYRFLHSKRITMVRVFVNSISQHYIYRTTSFL